MQPRDAEFFHRIGSPLWKRALAVAKDASAPPVFCSALEAREHLFVLTRPLSESMDLLRLGRHHFRTVAAKTFADLSDADISTLTASIPGQFVNLLDTTIVSLLNLNAK